MSGEQSNNAAEQGPARAPKPVGDVAQELLVLRRRLALLTGLVVADTAMLIVLMILAR